MAIKSSRSKPIRLLLGLLTLLGTGVLLLILLILTETALTVWELIQSYPIGFIVLYTVLIALVAGTGFYITWRLFSRRSHKPKIKSPKAPSVEDQQLIQEQLQQAHEKGIDVYQARKEIAELKRRQESQEIHIALFGTISAGKSSLVNALHPDAQAQVDPRGGTTTTITHYKWHNDLNQNIILTDLPGLNVVGQRHNDIAREEAYRSLVIIYLCDSDLTRDQYQELEELCELNKPIIVVLNKIDLYSDTEVNQLKQRLQQHLSELNQSVDVVSISAGGQKEVKKIYANGQEQWVEREIPPNIESLNKVLHKYLKQSREKMQQSQDAGFYRLASQKLQTATKEYRQQEASKLVKQYSKYAMTGAVAAVTPGTDILIQGYLGINLVKALCKLYDVPVKDLDVKQFIDIASKHIRTKLPMILAISGNVLKAFPGIGTVTGGALHAVAYGLIFESLGKAVTESLDRYGELQPNQTLNAFEENLREDMEIRARQIARMAMESIVSQRTKSNDGT